MKKVPRRLAFILIAAAAALAVLLQLFDTLAGRNREVVHQELQRVLGKDVGFDRLETSVFGGFGFSAREFRVADHPRFAATPFVRARELLLGVSLWNLLLGRIVIDSVTLSEPEVQIIIDEAGMMNLSQLATRKKSLGGNPNARPRLSAPERDRSGVSFRVSSFQIRRGRVEYIDRSSREPAEMRIKNVEMAVKRQVSTGRLRLKVAAAVSEGVGQDVRIEGLWTPERADRDWTQQPVDLEMQFDSLDVPFISRAIVFLRNKIPRELDVTGPLSLRTRLTGTLERPRLTEIDLKAPLFGSSNYNAIMEGSADLSLSGAWKDARLQGKLTLNPVELAQFRRLSFVKQALPPGLVTEGAMAIQCRFEGTWETLRIGALVKANRSDLHYREWLHKPAGTTAEIRAGISRHHNVFTLHESELKLGGAKIALSGFIDMSPAGRKLLKFRSPPGPLETWAQMVSAAPFDAQRGKAEWDLAVERISSAGQGNWTVRGQLKFAGAELRLKQSGRILKNLSAEIEFLGERARIDNVAFRLGSSSIAMAISTADLTASKMSYSLRSPSLSLLDLQVAPFDQPGRLKQVSASGEFQMQNGIPLISATVSSPEGTLQDVSYRNLRADVKWSPTGMTFTNLGFHALDGTLRSEGYWVANGAQSRRLEITSKAESVALRALVAQIFPLLKDHLDGQLDFHGRFGALTPNGKSYQETLKGSGDVLVLKGAIKNFNLMAQLFRTGSRSSVASMLPQRLPDGLAELTSEPDTRFESIKASFTVEQQRIRTYNLVLSTVEYDIAGAGWVAFDGSTSWNGLLILSPRNSQAMLNHNKLVRPLMDRRKRVSVPFRVEGALPNIRVRPDTRALAQAIRKGSLPQTLELPPMREKRQEQSERREFLPESLEQLLHR